MKDNDMERLAESNKDIERRREAARDIYRKRGKLRALAFVIAIFLATLIRLVMPRHNWRVDAILVAIGVPLFWVLFVMSRRGERLMRESNGQGVSQYDKRFGAPGESE